MPNGSEYKMILNILNLLSWCSVKKSLVILLCLALSPFMAEAQQYFFQTYGQEEGLPVSTVNDIAEDPLGFMWIATEGGGLAKFDGQRAIVFRTAQGLPSDYVSRLLYHPSYGLIIGTEKGVVVYDGFRFSKPWDLPEERVVAITSEGDGVYFIYRRAVVKLNAEGVFTFPKIPGDVECMSGLIKDDLYVGTATGLWKWEGNDWIKWWEGSNVRSIFVPQDTAYKGTIQVGAANDVYLILGKGIAVNNLSEGTDGVGVHPDVRDIVLDDAGRWWYGSYQEGLRRYDANEELGSRGIKITQDEGLHTPKIRCLFVSSDGRLWIGGLSGLSRLVEEDLFRYTSVDGLRDERIHAVYQASNGDWWMGGLSGLSKRSKNGDFTVYTENNGLPSGLIFDITETSDGVLWVATESGLARKSGDRFVLYGRSSGLGNAFVFDIDAFANGDLAVATTQGIYKFTQGHFEVVDQNLSTSAFSRLQIDDEDHLWVMDIEGRIMKQVEGGWEAAFGDAVRNRISPATFQVKDHVIWIGSNGKGLWRIENGEIDSVGVSEGLISNNVWSLDVLANDIWIGTDLGIQNLNWSGRWGFGTRVSEARGFGLMECNPHSIERTARSVIFGTNQGVLVAPLRRHMEVQRKGALHLEKIDLFFEQPESWKPWSDTIRAWDGLPLNLVLPYDQNYLRFSYTALSVADPTELQYQYKLSPLNQEWADAQSRTEAIYTSVPPGKYTFEVKAYDPLSGNTLRSEPYEFVIKPPFWRTWWFYTLAVLTLGGAVMLYIRMRLQRIRVRLALEEEKNDLERRALRLQMNPHFVFNALDAISGFIFKNEPKEAVKYLNNFAKLMRLMLESSREHVIPIHSEIQLLENYLALEKLRFSGEFDSEIIVDEELDTYGLSMPSMMVQPHIENAILHGLRPKGGGKVTVHFELMEEENGLRCVIEDNGVGRKKAAEIREKSGRNHRSLAGEISRRRVELFEKTYGGRSAVITQDLYDDKGMPSGTRVVLQLPLQSTDEWDEA